MQDAFNISINLISFVHCAILLQDISTAAFDDHMSGIQEKAQWDEFSKSHNLQYRHVSREKETLNSRIKQREYSTHPLKIDKWKEMTQYKNSKELRGRNWSPNETNLHEQNGNKIYTVEPH